MKLKRGTKVVGTGICRNTLAVFMQPNREEPMAPPEGIPNSDVYVRGILFIGKWML